jgi:hypothetical protein
MNSNFWILPITNSNQENREIFATRFALRSFQGILAYFDDVVIISDNQFVNQAFNNIDTQNNHSATSG